MENVSFILWKKLNRFFSQPSIPLLISYLNDIFTDVNRVLTSPVITILLLMSIFMSVSVFIVYLYASTLGA